MKKIVIIITILLSLTLTACKNDTDNNEITNGDKVTIQFGGSTSVKDVIEAVSNAFKSEAPRFDYVLNQTGSSDGYKRTLGTEKENNPAQIGFASRDFKTTEDVSKALFAKTFAKDAIAVVVHKDKGVTNLTQEQILGIYKGTITKWSEIDSSLTGTINVYSRDEASGTRGAFQDIIGFEDEDLLDDTIITTGNGHQATSVGQDIDGIGYVSLSTDFEGSGIKAVKYNGIEASNENTLSGDYTLARPFNLTTRSLNDWESSDERDMVLAFIAYLGTKDAMAIMSNEGVIVDDTNAPLWEDIKDLYPITK